MVPGSFQDLVPQWLTDLNLFWLFGVPIKKDEPKKVSWPFFAWKLREWAEFFWALKHLNWGRFLVWLKQIPKKTFLPFRFRARCSECRRTCISSGRPGGPAKREARLSEVRSAEGLKPFIKKQRSKDYNKQEIRKNDLLGKSKTKKD